MNIRLRTRADVPPPARVPDRRALRHAGPRASTLWLAALVAILAAPALSATRNVTVVRLAYVPQQLVGTADLRLDPEMFDTAFRLDVRDDRRIEPDVLGSRTDDDDRPYVLRTKDDLPAFVGGVLETIASGWRLKVDPEADRRLLVDIARYEVIETNQAVGASYEAFVRLALELRGRDDAVLWRGTADGDASRYGKKFSNVNCNEVLSDALLEAFATGMSDDDLHAAWVGGTVAAGSDTSPAAVREPVAPPELLADLARLQSQGTGESVLVAYARGRALTRALTADEVLQWKDAGIPDAVLEVVLQAPVVAEDAGTPPSGR